MKKEIAAMSLMAMFVLMVFPLVETEGTDAGDERRFQTDIETLTKCTLSPHNPIHIEGDSNFTAANGVTGGNGTQNNPYIIEGWEINASSANGIEIGNTNAHFVIRNCSAFGDVSSGSKCGILLDSVTHGKVEHTSLSKNKWCGISLSYSTNNLLVGNTVSENGNGIEIGYSSSNTLSNNDISNSSYGVLLEGAITNTVAENSISNNNNGVYMKGYMGSCTGNVISNNTISNNSGGIGLEWDCGSNVVSGNKILLNGNMGIYLGYSSDSNTISCNTISNNGDGVYVYRSDTTHSRAMPSRAME